MGTSIRNSISVGSIQLGTNPKSVVIAPNLLSLTTDTDGLAVLLTFDVNMDNPDTYASDFTLKVGGVSVAIDRVALEIGTKIITVYPVNNINISEVVTLSIASGHIKSADGGALAAITDQSVTNNAIGVAYYVSNTGSDAADGKTQATAWQTISKIVGSFFVGGDRILFKKSDTWRERLLFPSSGNSTHPILISSYGTGVKPVMTTPIITATWTLSGSVYNAVSVIGEYSIFWEDGISLKKATSSACTDGNWFFATGGLMYYKPTTGTPTDHVLQYANTTAETHLRTEAINVSDKSYITISDIGFKNVGIGVVSYDQGVGTESIKVENCDFISCWRGVLFMPNANANKNAIITNNYFKWCQAAIGMYTNTAPGFGTYHTEGTNTNPVISYNEIDQCGTTNGTDYWSHSTDWEGIGLQNVSGALIHHNDIHGGYIIGFEIYNQATRISANNQFYQNRIDNVGAKQPVIYTGSAGHGGFNNNSFHYNVIANTTTGTFITWNQGVSPTQMNYMLNNTFAPTVGAGCHITITQTNLALYLTVKNNIHVNVGSYAFRCEGNPTQLVMDRNIYKLVNTGNTTPFLLNGWKSIAQMRTAGYETNGQMADPLLVSTSDFHLQNGSPAINTGVDVGLPTDYEGNTIVGIPDVGAYERQ